MYQYDSEWDIHMSTLSFFNSVDDIFKQSDICQENHGRAPNVVMVSVLAKLTLLPVLGSVLDRPYALTVDDGSSTTLVKGRLLRPRTS